MSFRVFALTIVVGAGCGASSKKPTQTTAPTPIERADSGDKIKPSDVPARTPEAFDFTALDLHFKHGIEAAMREPFGSEARRARIAEIMGDTAWDISGMLAILRTLDRHPAGEREELLQQGLHELATETTENHVDSALRALASMGNMGSDGCSLAPSTVVTAAEILASASLDAYPALDEAAISTARPLIGRLKAIREFVELRCGERTVLLGHLPEQEKGLLVVIPR